MRALLLLLAFVGVPLLEIFVLIQVGQTVGVWWTVLVLLAVSILGAWLLRHQGRRSWRALREAVQSGRPPERELLDAGLVLAGGSLMLVPGFVTDVFGLLLILPLTRPVARSAVRWALGRQLVRGMATMPPRGWPGSAGGQSPRPRGGPERDGGPDSGRDASERGPVIEGEVVEEPPEDPPRERFDQDRPIPRDRPA